MDTHIEKNTPQLPQDMMIVSDKEERTCTASKSEQVDGLTPTSKTPLSRYHEKISYFSFCISLSG